MLIEGSRKKGCHTIKKCIAYPEYKVELQGKATLRTLREKKTSELKAALSTRKCVTSCTVYFVSLSTEDAHTGHLTGNEAAGFSQRVNEKVAAKISELVAEGIMRFEGFYGTMLCMIYVGKAHQILMTEHTFLLIMT